jgi:hypothetical protein
VIEVIVSSIMACEWVDARRHRLGGRSTGVVGDVLVVVGGVWDAIGVRERTKKVITRGSLRVVGGDGEDQ